MNQRNGLTEKNEETTYKRDLERRIELINWVHDWLHLLQMFPKSSVNA